MATQEKPPGMGKILEFKKPDANIHPPERPRIAPPNIPIGVDEPLDIRDEKYRAGHRALRKKFDDADKATAAVDQSLGTVTRGIEAPMRNMMIDTVTRSTGHPRDEVARSLDTQLLTERAQADLDEDEYVRLRELPGEESEAILEEAYRKAKEKYGHMYPAAAPTMFEHFKIPKAPQKESQPKEPEQSLIDRIRDRLTKLF